MAIGFSCQATKEVSAQCHVRQYSSMKTTDNLSSSYQRGNGNSSPIRAKYTQSASVIESHMEPPLRVVTDRDGILRDVHDRPMIVVFNSTKNDVDTAENLVRRPKQSARQTGTPFAFVQVSGSKNEDRATRTMIRTHIMQDHFRRKREKTTRPCKSRNGDPSGVSVQASVIESDDLFRKFPLPPQPKATLDPFAKFPVEMNPCTYYLVEHYMTIIIPCAQPTEFGWASSFSHGMRDPTLFNVILLTAAVHICFLNGNTISPEALFLRVKAIQTVNERFRESPTVISDDMIHAVTFMAMCEGLGADQGAANAHLDGLTQMIEARGGLLNLSHDLQQKICVADFLCCMEPDKRPRFRLPTSSKYSTYTKSPSNLTVLPGFLALQKIITLDSEFIAIVLDIEDFSILFRQACSYDFRKKLIPSDYDVTSIWYRLLSMESARRSGTHKELVGDACRIGALIFIKTVFDRFGCWGLERKADPPPCKTLVEKLKVYLTRFDRNCDALKTEYLGLMLWLAYMGSSLKLEVGNRKWYNSRLVATAAKLGLQSWEGVEAVLTKFLWIEWVHQLRCKELWENIQGEQTIRGISLPD